MTAETGERRAVLIAGPTASGKSALALAIAERCDGVVVNADSMQVYRELRILTARPSAEEEARAPHRLYGHIAGGEGYTVARYLDDLERTLKDLADRPAVIVGGTGLYFNAMTQGLSDVPPVVFSDPEAAEHPVPVPYDRYSRDTPVFPGRRCARWFLPTQGRHRPRGRSVRAATAAARAPRPPCRSGG